MKHHWLLSVWFLLFSLNGAFNKDAIKYFVKHKRVKNFSIGILNGKGNSSSRWVEYKYVFEINNYDNNDLSNIIVGVFLQNDSKFDCKLTKSNTYVGYSIAIVEVLQQYFNFSLTYVPLNDTADIEQLLENKVIDLAICYNNIFMSNNVTQLYPTLKNKYILIYKPANLEFTKDIFVLTFAGSLWLVFLILLVVLAILLKISTKKYSMLHPHYEPWSWVEITLWAIAAACQQGLSHTPSGFASCCIFLFGYLTSYLLYTGFAAAITSLLVQQDAYYKLDVLKMSSEIQLTTLESLKYDHLHIMEKFQKLNYVENLKTLLKSLDEPKTAALAPEILINEYKAKHTNTEDSPTYLIKKLSNLEYTNGFLILRRHKWRRLLANKLLKLEEEGILQKMLMENLSPVSVAEADSGYSSAGKEHIGSAVYVLSAGIAASVIFLMGECCIFFYKKSRGNFSLQTTQE